MTKPHYSIQIVFSDEPHSKYLLAWKLKIEEVAWLIEGIRNEILLAYFIGETHSDRSIRKHAWFRTDEKYPSSPSNFKNVFVSSFRQEAYQSCSVKFGRSLPNGTFQSVLEMARMKYLQYLKETSFSVEQLYGKSFIENFKKPYPIFGKNYEGPVASCFYRDFFRPLKPGTGKMQFL